MSQRMPPVQYISTGVSGGARRSASGSAASPDTSVGGLAEAVLHEGIQMAGVRGEPS